MDETRPDIDDKVITLDHIFYHNPEHVGPELDDFERCYGEWLRAAGLSRQFSDGALQDVVEGAVGLNNPAVTIVLLNQKTARFVGFFVAFPDRCGGKLMMRVPIINWDKRIDDATEDAVLNEVFAYGVANGCEGALVHTLSFQRRLRAALKRQGGEMACSIYRCGGDK